MGAIRDLYDLAVPDGTPNAFWTWAGEVSDAADQAADPHEGDQPQSQYDTELARVFLGGKAAIMPFLGDSFTESMTPSVRQLRWTDHLNRLMNGRNPYRVQYVPAAANLNSTNVPADWPGGQQPVSYTGSVVGDVSFGADLHSAAIPTSGTITLTYYGDAVTLVYVQKPGAPSAAAVTLDGVAQTALNAQGTQTPGKLITYAPQPGPPADLDYGFHTLVVTATGAPLTVEGFVVHDGTAFLFGVPNRAVQTYALGHVGFSTANFTGNTNWATSLANMCSSSALGTAPAMVGIGLGANDAGASVPAGTFQNNLVTIMQMIDSAVAANSVTADHGYLLIAFPTMPDSYVQAQRTAAKVFNAARVDTLNLRERLPGGGTGWGIFDAGNGHPNDAGQLWIARQIQEHLLGTPYGEVPNVREGGPVIWAADPPTTRVNWAESLQIAGGHVSDASPTGTTQGERRHRIWFEPGTYTPELVYEQVSSGGTLAILVGTEGSPNALTSVISQATAGTAGTFSRVAGTPVTFASPGARPVYFRKTTASGGVRPVRLSWRRT